MTTTEVVEETYNNINQKGDDNMWWILFILIILYLTGRRLLNTATLIAVIACIVLITHMPWLFIALALIWLIACNI